MRVRRVTPCEIYRISCLSKSSLNHTAGRLICYETRLGQTSQIPSIPHIRMRFVCEIIAGRQRKSDSWRCNQLDPLGDGEYTFLSNAVRSFVQNGWFERCKPAFRTKQDQLDWESVRPPGYCMPTEDIPVCYCSVMIYGVRKKLELLHSCRVMRACVKMPVEMQCSFEGCS